MDLTLVHLDNPTETRTFDRGRFELYSVGPMTIGRATYEPGWRWSEHVGAPAGASSCMGEHVGAEAGASSCMVEHVGIVISGRAAVKMDGGEERIMGPGDLFYVPPGHDSWVVGDESYVSLHLLGSEDYAA